MGSISISVPSVLEIEAPLGGKSIEYKISISTDLPFYKDSENRDGDVQFTIQKALREIEDFYDKISKKFKNASLPPIPKGRLRLTSSNEEKRAALDAFMRHISKDKEIYDSSIFQNFIGFDKIKHQFQVKKSETSAEDPLSDIISSIKEPENGSKGKDDFSDGSIVISGVSNKDTSKKNSDQISQLFPKMKVRKTSNPESATPEEFNNNDSLFSTHKIPNLADLDNDDLDLFEEVKHIKDVKTKKSDLENESDRELFNVNTKRLSSVNEEKSKKIDKTNHTTDLEDDSEKHKKVGSNLFGEDFYFESKSERDKKLMFGAESEELFEEVVKEDLKSNKKQSNLGKVTLFEQQDFGSSILKEDEQLFFIPDQEEKTAKANPFLSPTSESTDEQEESLENLIQVQEPLIYAKAPSVVPDLLKEEAKKPVPATRTKLPSNSSNPDASNVSKPQVAPRKVYLAKSQPPASNKPEIKAKPAPPPKPKVAKKPSPNNPDLVDNPSQPPKDVSNDKNEEKLISDLNSMDIMQYIEQEEKAAVLGANLFD